MGRILMRWPWQRMGAILAALTLGGSQILFNLILENRSHFPDSRVFHVWVLVWAQLLPFALLFGVELLAGRSGSPRLWRTSLYALAAFSFARQLQFHHAGLFYAVFPAWASLPACLLAAAAAAWISIRRPVQTDRLFAVLGLLAIVLSGVYVRGTMRTPTASPSAAAGPAAPIRPGPPVVVLMFDELGLDVLLKDGRIDPEAFPRLAALADEGAWFPQATAVSPFTEESVPSMLTGRDRPAEEDPFVFERLRETHRSTVQIPWNLLEDRIRRGLGPGDRLLRRIDARALRLGPLETMEFLRMALVESPLFRTDFGPPTGEALPLPDLWDLWESRDVLTIEVESFLGILAAEAGPGRLLFWHCSLPHSPFQYDRDGRRHGRAATAFAPRLADAGPVWANYREQARGVDRLVGLVVDRLKAMGLYEETLLVVTSDHGPRTAGAGEPAGYPDVQSGVSVRIPFVLRGPSIAPGPREADYRNTDFAPTLLDLLGHRAEPGAFDGRPALGTSMSPRERVFFHRGKAWVLDGGTGPWRRKGEGR